MDINFSPSPEPFSLLELVRLCREARSSLLNERRRNKNYVFGNQWGDLMEVEGKLIREEDFLRLQGSLPLKNNLIRRIVRNVTGIFRRDLTTLMKEWSETDRERARLNRMETVYARCFEEFLISGITINRKWTGCREGIPGVWTDIVSPEDFFFDPLARDPRGSDLSVVGEIHRLSGEAFCLTFARDEHELALLRDAYGRESAVTVYEIWRRVPKLLFRDGRAVHLSEWRYVYITSAGAVVREGCSPYPHHGHPFVFTAYPFIDGEVHAFVGDLIDQQRYTNRLITLYDWVIRASAKGVLLFPEEALSRHQNFMSVAKEWSKYNGVILFKGKDLKHLPQQVTGNTMHIGIGDLLNIQLKMMEDVSGVSGALQGRYPAAGVSGTLYNQQTENSLVSLRDILDSFNSFISDSLLLENHMENMGQRQDQ